MFLVLLVFGSALLFLSGACLKGMAYFGCGLLVVGWFFGVFVVAKNKRGEIHSLLEVQC